MLLRSEPALKRYNLAPIGKYLGFSVAGVPLAIIGIGPKEAIPRMLKQEGAGPGVVNPPGWAIRTATLLHGLRRRKQKYGMVTMCIVTGMGAAGIFEAL